MKPWFVYILQCSDKTLYTGITNDLARRVQKHSAGRGAKYMRGRRPSKIIYFQECTSKSKALKEEARIKRLARREKLLLGGGERCKLPTKLFKVVNDGFVCQNCGKEILSTTCGTPRNHCPFCLYSKHVDINVGDRANLCGGMMKPIGITKDSKKGFVIEHRCVKCGEIMRSKAIQKGIQPDDFDLIVAISSHH